MTQNVTRDVPLATAVRTRALMMASMDGHVVQEDLQEFVAALAGDGVGVDDSIDACGKSALHYAAVVGRAQAVKYLIEEGYDVNRQDENQQTPLHMVFPVTDYYHLMVEVGGGGVDEEYRDHTSVLIAEELLKNGADPNLQDYGGFSPLHYALLQGSAGVVRSLVKSGAELTINNIEGNTPLHLAAGLDCLDLLLTAYGDLDSRDPRGETLLHKLMRPAGNDYFTQIVLGVLDRGPTVDIRNDRNFTPLQCGFQRMHDYFMINRSVEKTVLMKRVLEELHFRNVLVLTKHIVKLRTAGVRVSDNGEYILRMKDGCVAEDIRDWFREFREELEVMAATPVLGDVTLGRVFKQILTRKTAKRCHHLAQPGVVQVVESISSSLDFEIRFPVYGKIFQNVFKRSAKRYGLMREGLMSLTDAKRSPHLSLLLYDLDAVDLVFEYLSDEDLENLIKSV